MSSTGTYDPALTAPEPPTESLWHKQANGPPSPFPWSTSGFANASPPRTPDLSSSSSASPPRAASSAPIGSSQPLGRSGSQFGAGASLSPSLASSVWAAGSPNLGSRRASVPLQSIGGARTPSGFEFLDFGESTEGVKKTRTFEWEIHGDPNDSLNSPGQTFKRRLGPTEVSYYLGSRGEGVESGVNDMYLHVGFKAKSKLITPERVLDAWSEIVNQHALLACWVEYEGSNDIRFVYDPPKTQADARAKAKSLMEVRTDQNAQALLDGYLNGERTLSDERLAYLVISTPESTFGQASADSEAEQEFDFFLFSTHFLGDGMALHTTANEFFNLIADKSTDEEALPTKNIDSVLADRGEAVTKAEAEFKTDVDNLAHAMESKLITPTGWGRMAWAGARVEFNRNQAKLIGGHAFPRAKLGERKTIVPTISWPAAETKKILGNCKAHGATIATAVFALANIAFIRSTEAGTAKGQRDERLPMMLYSALNVRGFLQNEGDWYHIAIGYYNIILPAFLPRSIDVAKTFWYRALVVRQQTSAVVKSKWMGGRTKLMALERERRSIGFEKEDERRRQEKKNAALGLSEAVAGLGIGFGGEEPAPVKVVAPPPAPTAAPVAAVAEKVAFVAPSTALTGLSMLGNLDAMYTHKTLFGLSLHTLTTGSRQRPGASLLFAYTFAGKFWLSLGYDERGYAKGSIDKWWEEVLKGVDEFLLA